MPDGLDIPTSAAKSVRDFSVAEAGELGILAAAAVHELVVIDAAVPDKQQFYRALKPGVETLSGRCGCRRDFTLFPGRFAVHVRNPDLGLHCTICTQGIFSSRDE